MDPATIAAIMAAIGKSAPQLIQGLFGNSGDPSRNAGREFNNYYNKNIDAISGEKDPTAFINKLMGGYQESPWAHNLQTQSIRSATNAASANGLSGSTPMMQQIQQNANNISSGDQNQWLQHVLGINKDYLDRYTGLTERQGQNAANASYGQTMGQNYDKNQLLQGIMQMLFGGGGNSGGYSGGQQFPSYLGN
jgi:hypothetical protein